MSLAIIILTKNEEKNITDVITNARLCTDEVIIVDSGSTDKTVELASELKAKVVFREWDNDFSAQRNFALTQTEADWILYLDADERMNPVLIESIKNVVTHKEDKQYSIMRKVRSFGHEFHHGIFKPDFVTRLFPTNSVYWENKVHERPVCALKLEKLNGYIEHYTYESWRQWMEKANYYTDIWAKDNFTQGKRASLGSAFLHASFGFIRAYVFQGGFLDGWFGLYSSIQHFTYTVMKYLKLYEIQKQQ